MATAVCHWHPDRETGLRCSRCGKPICVECMRQHPVGVRCKECYRESRLPTYQVSPGYLARGVGAAIGLGVAGSVALIILERYLPFAGFFFFIIMIGMGYLVGEGVGAAVGRRRGRTYQYIGAAGALLATAPVLAPLLLSQAVGFGSLFSLVGVFVAVLVAWSRLAP